MDAHRLLAHGVDPSVNRAATKAASADSAANSFEVVAQEWFAKKVAAWVESHGSRVIARLENDIFPFIGARPIAEITAAELLTTLRRIEARGAGETAHRALNNCAQIFRYAVVTGRAPSDPTGALRGALIPVKEQHLAAVTDPKRAGELLRAISSYVGTPTVRCALRLAPLVFVRPGELRTAQWADIDLDAGEAYPVGASNMVRAPAARRPGGWLTRKGTAPQTYAMCASRGVLGRRRQALAGWPLGMRPTYSRVTRRRGLNF